MEKLKHDEKETMKLQDGIQSLQLRLAAREHSCRCLQEKVGDAVNDLLKISNFPFVLRAHQTLDQFDFLN